jgi:hypothetical protein
LSEFQNDAVTHLGIGNGELVLNLFVDNRLLEKLLQAFRQLALNCGGGLMCGEGGIACDGIRLTEPNHSSTEHLHEWGLC